jgi:lipoprotein-releasing system ATP-binding protein
MIPVLSCEALKRSFTAGSERISVLQGVNLTVRAGEVAAILGPSGSGKSTLLRLLAGLDSPDSGRIWWRDFPVHEHRPAQLARQRAQMLGLVFQQHYLLEDLTASENISLPGRIRGDRDLSRANELLQEVGLAGRADFLPRLLSGGERQRVAVARALFDEPPLILADEPTGSLDRSNARAVYQLLVDLARRQGAAVVLVTHDEGLIESVDSRYDLIDGQLRLRPPLPAATAAGGAQPVVTRGEGL